MAEKRAYPRYPITLDVAVTAAGKQPFFCIMKDFCFGGIYLLFNPSFAPAGSPQFQMNEQLSIDFNSPLDPTGETHRLQGRVVRVEDQGLGIAFTTQNIRALQALQQLAGNVTPEMEAEPARGSNVQYRAVASSVGKELTSFAAELIDKVIETCDETLFRRASEARTNAEQTDFFDAIKELKDGHDSIIEEFNNRITRKLSALLSREHCA